MEDVPLVAHVLANLSHAGPRKTTASSNSFVSVRVLFAVLS